MGESNGNGKLQLADPPDGGAVPQSYAEMQDALDRFVDAMNRELRNRGFHACQATVGAGWLGECVLSVSYPLNVRAPNGQMVFLNVQAAIPVPWGRPPELDDTAVLNAALAACETRSSAMCAAHPGKPLKLNFGAVARSMGRIQPVGSTSIVPPAPNRIVSA